MQLTREAAGRVATWLALANAAGVLVWLGVFMNWVAPTYGRLDAELVGASTFAWPLVVLAASALVLLAPPRSALRRAAWLAVALLAAIVADQAIGALRDGEIGAPGLRLGLLMVAELVAAAASVGLATVAGRAARDV